MKVILKHIIPRFLIYIKAEYLFANLGMEISRDAAQQWRHAALPSHVRANSHAYISARIAVQ